MHASIALGAALGADARERSNSSPSFIAFVALLSLLSLAAVETADAQGRGRGNNDRGRDAQGIPPGHLPAPGECRVWYDNRPPGQQPRPTSCANARATAARNGGRVIYGDDSRRDARADEDRRRADGRRDDDRRADARRDDGRRECKEKDRRKGKCGAARERDDERYPDGRYPDGRYPDGRDRDNGPGYPGDTYPRTLPEMVWGVEYGRGTRTDAVRQWVGAESVRVSYTDSDRNGAPELVTWTSFAGRLVQRWIDDNRDGRADRVELYENNRAVRVIR